MIKLNDDGWRKSSRSGQGGDDCVELQGAPGITAARDSKHKNGEILSFAPGVFAKFGRRVKEGMYDRPGL